MVDIEDDVVVLFDKEEDFKPTEVECIDKKNILTAIRNSNFPETIKEKLYTLNNMVNMAKKHVIPMPNSLLIRMGNKNRDKMLKIIESIYIQKGVCDNAVYELKMGESVGQFVHKQRCIIVKHIRREREFFLNLSNKETSSLIVYFIPPNEDGIMDDLHIGTPVFSMVLDVAYSPNEIIEYCKSVAKEFSMAIELDVSPDDSFFKRSISIGRLDTGLRNLMFSFAQDIVKQQIPINEVLIPLSSIINAYENPFDATKEPTSNVLEEERKQKFNAQIKFEDIIGLDVVKKKVNRIAAYIKKTGDNETSKHMAFLGNPGTGKTIMARALAYKLFEEGITQSDKFVEASRGDLVGEYIGQTSKKTREVFEKAKGGVLFIDEAYSLFVHAEDTKDFGNEAISTLIKLMEDNRDNTIVIFAGYKENMQSLIDSNPGLRSRIQYEIEFPNYSIGELIQIMDLQLVKTKFVLSAGAKKEIISIIEKEKDKKDFSNGRFVRNLLEGVELIQSARAKEDDFILSKEDVLIFISEMKPEEKAVKFGF